MTEIATVSEEMTEIATVSEEMTGIAAVSEVKTVIAAVSAAVGVAGEQHVAATTSKQAKTRHGGFGTRAPQLSAHRDARRRESGHLRQEQLRHRRLRLVLRHLRRPVPKMAEGRRE